MEEVESAKGRLRSAIEAFGRVSTTEKGGLGGFQLRLQMAYNSLVQNERRIWLRTRDGREILERFNRAALRLLEASYSIIENLRDESIVREFENALLEVEECARRLDEESRRRSMVVT